MSSACTSSTDVTTAMVGRTISQSHAMCPAPREPISITATSVSSWAFTSVSGTPSSLLKLFSLAVTTWSRARAAAARSLVDVLPTDPVMPTTRSPRRLRAKAPRVVKAAATSGTTMELMPGSGSRAVKVATAPESRAEAMN